MRIGWSRIRTSLAVLSSALAGLALLAGAAYRTGRACDTETAFLATFRPPTLDETCVATVGEEALWGTDYNDVVFVGDSTCRTGIDPRIFERLTGLTAYNLGLTISCRANGFLVMGAAYLSSHPKPKALVLCVTPAGFEFPAWGELEERIVTTYGPHVPGLPADLIFKQPWSEACRIGFVLNFRALTPFAIDPRGNPTTVDMENYRRSQQKAHENRGYLALNGTERFDPLIMAMEPSSLTVDPTWTRCVHALAAICESSGVRFLLRIEPISSSRRKLLNCEHVEEWLREIERSCKGVTVCRPALLWYDPPFLHDDFHLNTIGVDRFMPVVAKDVLTALGKKPVDVK
jgi:hypothetical protein